MSDMLRWNERLNEEGQIIRVSEKLNKTLNALLELNDEFEILKEQDNVEDATYMRWNLENLIANLNLLKNNTTRVIEKAQEKFEEIKDNIGQ